MTNPSEVLQHYSQQKRDEIIGMSAGREMDVLVAKEIFGVTDPDKRWSPSTNIKDAFDVVTELIPRYTFSLQTSVSSWIACFISYKAERNEYLSNRYMGNTAPEAICKAALLAVIGGNEE